MAVGSCVIDICISVIKRGAKMNRCWATFCFVLFIVVMDRDEVHLHKNVKNHLERQDWPIKHIY